MIQWSDIDGHAWQDFSAVIADRSFEYNDTHHCLGWDVNASFVDENLDQRGVLGSALGRLYNLCLQPLPLGEKFVIPDVRLTRTASSIHLDFFGHFDELIAQWERLMDAFAHPELLDDAPQLAPVPFGWPEDIAARIGARNSVYVASKGIPLRGVDPARTSEMIRQLAPWSGRYRTLFNCSNPELAHQAQQILAAHIHNSVDSLIAQIEKEQQTPTHDHHIAPAPPDQPRNGIDQLVKGKVALYPSADKPQTLFSVLLPYHSSSLVTISALRYLAKKYQFSTDLIPGKGSRKDKNIDQNPNFSVLDEIVLLNEGIYMRMAADKKLTLEDVPFFFALRNKLLYDHDLDDEEIESLIENEFSRFMILVWEREFFLHNAPGLDKPSVEQVRQCLSTLEQTAVCLTLPDPPEGFRSLEPCQKNKKIKGKYFFTPVPSHQVKGVFKDTKITIGDAGIKITLLPDRPRVHSYSEYFSFADVVAVVVHHDRLLEVLDSRGQIIALPTDLGKTRKNLGRRTLDILIENCPSILVVHETSFNAAESYWATVYSVRTSRGFRLFLSFLLSMLTYMVALFWIATLFYHPSHPSSDYPFHIVPYGQSVTLDQGTTIRVDEPYRRDEKTVVAHIRLCAGKDEKADAQAEIRNRLFAQDFIYASVEGYTSPSSPVESSYLSPGQCREIDALFPHAQEDNSADENSHHRVVYNVYPSENIYWEKK